MIPISDKGHALPVDADILQLILLLLIRNNLLKCLSSSLNRIAIQRHFYGFPLYTAVSKKIFKQQTKYFMCLELALPCLYCLYFSFFLEVRKKTKE